MRYYDEIYSEVVPFKFIKYIALGEGLTGVAFVVLFFLHINGTLGIEDELPYFFFPLMAAVMLGVAVFLYSLVRLKLGITTDVVKTRL